MNRIEKIKQLSEEREKILNCIYQKASLSNLLENGMPYEMYEKIQNDTILEQFGIDTENGLSFDKVSSFHNEFAYITVENKSGVITNTGRLCILPIYDELKAFDENVPFSEMTFCGSKYTGEYGDCCYKVINSDGIMTTKKYFEEINTQSSILYPAKYNGEVGAIDRFGKTVIPFGKFSNIQRFYKTENNEVFGVISNGSNVGLINNRGDVVIPFECGYETVMYVDNYTVITTRNGKFGVIDMNCNILIPFEYDYIDCLKNGFRYVKKGDKYGFIDINNKILKVN